MVRTSMKKAIRKEIEKYRNYQVDHNKALHMYAYNHETDFWHGLLVGSLNTTSYFVFEKLIGRPPNDEEKIEIDELIQLYNNDIKDVINSWK